MDKTSLILGTVQLGMNYGIANTDGQPKYHSALEIVRTAWEGGVNEFDTAISYGESEAVLGSILRELDIAAKAKVNSKPDTKWDGEDFDALDRDLDASLKRIGVDRLHTLLLHREHLLDNWDRFGPDLIRLVDEGRINHIGVSVYAPDSALKALSLEGLDVVQIPSNFLDRRFEKAGVAKSAADLGKTLQIRSIFLQGVIFMQPETMPESMRFAESEIRDIRRMLDSLELSPLEAAMGYARQAWSGSGILFGAETAQQVRENLTAFNTPVPDELLDEAQTRFPDVPEKVLNPALWGV